MIERGRMTSSTCTRLIIKNEKSDVFPEKIINEAENEQWCKDLYGLWHYQDLYFICSTVDYDSSYIFIRGILYCSFQNRYCYICFHFFKIDLD